MKINEIAKLVGNILNQPFVCFTAGKRMPRKFPDRVPPEINILFKNDRGNDKYGYGREKLLAKMGKHGSLALWDTPRDTRSMHGDQCFDCLRYVLLREKRDGAEAVSGRCANKRYEEFDQYWRTNKCPDAVPRPGASGSVEHLDLSKLPLPNSRSMPSVVIGDEVEHLDLSQIPLPERNFLPQDP